jgi:hypothetical protein
MLAIRAFESGDRRVSKHKRFTSIVELSGVRKTAGRGEVTIVNLEGDLAALEERAVKAQNTKANMANLEQDRPNREKLKHAFIVGFQKYFPATNGKVAASLSPTNHLPP